MKLLQEVACRFVGKEGNRHRRPRNARALGPGLPKGHARTEVPAMVGPPRPRNWNRS